MEPTNDYILSLEDKTWNYLTEEEESTDTSQACLDIDTPRKDQKEEDEQDDFELP